MCIAGANGVCGIYIYINIVYPLFPLSWSFPGVKVSAFPPLPVQRDPDGGVLFFFLIGGVAGSQRISGGIVIESRPLLSGTHF